MDMHLEQFFNNFRYLNFGVLAYIYLIPLFIQKIENNYTHFRDLIMNVLSPKYLFKYIKISLTIALLNYFSNHITILHREIGYNNYSINIDYFSDGFKIWYEYLLAIILLSSVVYILFKNRISKYINSNTVFYKKKFVYPKYLIYSIIASAILVLITYIMFKIYSIIDSFLISHQFYPFNIDKSHGLQGYYKSGVYITITITTGVTFLFYNTLHKMLKEYESFLDIVNYFFILFLMVLGVFSGVYAISNYLVNFLDKTTYDLWHNDDKIKGLFSIRITALILMYSILSFIIRIIFNNQFVNIIKTGIFTLTSKVNERKDSNSLGYIKNYFDSYYFNQVSFYILHIFSAELIIASHEIDSITSILFLILPIMVDDFLVIHVYYKKSGYMEPFHRGKLIFFNVALVMSTALSLIYLNYLNLLIVYFVLLAFLYLSHYNNNKKYGAINHGYQSYN